MSKKIKGGLDIDNSTVVRKNFSATTIFSGNSDLSDVFAPFGDPGDITRVENGINTFTGGTDNNPTINVTGASLDNITVSGESLFQDINCTNLSANSISGTSFFSGNTDLSDVFSPFGYLGDITRLNNGMNTFTGGTDNNPTVNITGASLDSISVSGESLFESLSATTIYSGNSDLSDIIDGQLSKGLSALTTTFLDIFDQSGGSTTTVNTWTASVPFNSQRRVDSDFTHNTSVNNSEITINSNGVYLIMGRVSAYPSSNSRTQSQCRLEINQGTGFQEVLGTVSEMYLRSTSYGATATFFSVLTLNQGDLLRVTFRVSNGGSNVVLQPNGSSLIVSNIKGTKGDVGTKGDTGGTFALGLINSDGTNQYSKNLTSSRSSTGVYNFVFNSPPPDANYTVHTTFNGNASNVDDWTSIITNRDISGFTITTTSQDNSTIADVFTDLSFDVTVQGPSENISENISLFSGGTTNQFFKKASNSNYDFEWDSFFRDSNSSEIVSNTTSSSYVQKMRLNLTGLISANYEIKWYFELGNSGGSLMGDESSAKVELNDSVVLSEVSNSFNNTSFNSYNGFYETILSGNNTIDIDFLAVSGTANIRRARIVITKIN